jgi:hypothetical protein
MGWATFWAIFCGHWAIFAQKHLVTLWQLHMLTQCWHKTTRWGSQVWHFVLCWDLHPDNKSLGWASKFTSVNDGLNWFITTTPGVLQRGQVPCLRLRLPDHQPDESGGGQDRAVPSSENRYQSSKPNQEPILRLLNLQLQHQCCSRQEHF